VHQHERLGVGGRRMMFLRNHGTITNGRSIDALDQLVGDLGGIHE
jgi:hypothetical protein